jgi:hypothetical protein
VRVTKSSWVSITDAKGWRPRTCFQIPGPKHDLERSVLEFCLKENFQRSGLEQIVVKFRRVKVAGSVKAGCMEGNFHILRMLSFATFPCVSCSGAWPQNATNTRVYSKVSGLAAWSENCKWYTSLLLVAVVSLFCESV